MLSFCAGMASRIATRPMPPAAIPGHLELLLLGRLALLPDAVVEVVRDAGARGQRQPGDHREDRRERDRRDHRQQDRAAGGAGSATDGLGQQRRGEVAAGGRGPLVVLVVQQRRGTEAEHQREQVERADQADRPQHRLPGVPRGRHRVEADQDVRQAGGAEHQGDAERQEVDLAGRGGAVLQAGLEERLALAAVGGGGAEQVGEVEVELRQHQHHDQRRAGHQQHGLDDLHPGGALHAADGHVEDHQDADREDRQVDHRLAVDAEQQRRPGRRRRPSARAGRRSTRPRSRWPRRCAPGAGASGRPAGRPSCSGRSCGASRRPAAAPPARRPGSRSSRGSRRSRTARWRRRCRGTTPPTCSRRRWPGRSGSRRSCGRRRSSRRRRRSAGWPRR